MKEKAKILDSMGLCDRCLGRQFRGLFRGKENDVIGAIIREALKKDDFSESFLEKMKKKKKKGKTGCEYCDDIFKKLPKLTKKALKALKKYEFANFLAGSRIPKEIIGKEEKIWEKAGLEYTEPMKKELARTIGKIIEDKTKKPAKFESPDMLVLINFVEDSFELNPSPLYLFGRYRKLVRGIPQTKWYCVHCKGKGCEKCGGKGKMYEESVEELAGHELLKETGGEGTKFHGQGREDIDALTLGDGRPFVIEILNPYKRFLDLKSVEQKINDFCRNKVEISDLSPSNKEEVRLLKAIKLRKTYRILIECGEDISEEDLDKIRETFRGLEIAQKTPKRVSHRRSIKVRKRQVYETKCKLKGKREFEAVVEAESGLYVKELVSGDEGRTKPSFSEAIGKQCKTKELDVISVHDDQLRH